jgi:GNAT superfamily N-acetyltransferase
MHFILNSFLRMNLVNCNQEYWEFVRELRNDERVADGFIINAYISQEDQFAYMVKYKEFYRICLIDDIPVGYVGVIDNDIRVCTHPDFQKRGVAKFMIREVIKIWPSALAKIKVDNIASVKLFESCGFKKNFFVFSL